MLGVLTIIGMTLAIGFLIHPSLAVIFVGGAIAYCLSYLI